MPTASVLREKTDNSVVAYLK